MAVTGDHNIKVKKVDILKKYTNVLVEFARMWDIPATIFLVIIGAMGLCNKQSATLRKLK